MLLATFICPFISIFEPLQVQSAHLTDRFRMASICCLVKCILKCGVECRPNLEANVCFFEKCELRTFPWSPSWFEVVTFYPFTQVFTLKIGSNASKLRWFLKALMWRHPNMVRDFFSFLLCFCLSLIFLLLLLFLFFLFYFVSSQSASGWFVMGARHIIIELMIWLIK